MNRKWPLGLVVEMVKRPGMDDGRLAYDDNGDWVLYEDYAKLADLCGRMATLLKCVPYPIMNGRSKYAKEIHKALAEWEAMK